MSLQTDILAAFQKQASKTAETDTPAASQAELAADLAAAITTAPAPLNFGLVLNTDFLRLKDETLTTTDLEISRRPTEVKFDSPNKQITVEGTTAVNVTATDNATNTNTWNFHQHGWSKQPQLTANPPNPTGSGQEYFHSSKMMSFRYNGAAWRKKEPIRVQIQEFDRDVTVTAGLAKKVIIAPAAWDNLTITEYSCKALGGVGELEVKLNVDGSNTNTMVVENTTLTTVGASRTLTTGSVISIEVTAVPVSGLTGLIALFKIE